MCGSGRQFTGKANVLTVYHCNLKYNLRILAFTNARSYIRARTIDELNVRCVRTILELAKYNHICFYILHVAPQFKCTCELKMVSSICLNMHVHFNV